MDSTTNDERRENERFLPDEERILRLLAEHDGKMWQRGLIEETGWSASKVSRTLTAMDDGGRIVRQQIGRENLVAMPEQTAFGQARSKPIDSE